MLRRHTQRLRKIHSADTWGQTQGQGWGRFIRQPSGRHSFRLMQQTDRQMAEDRAHRKYGVENSNLGSASVR